MKKVWAAILALAMALSLCTGAWATGEGTGESEGTGGGETGGEPTYVAQIGETKYETLQAAVDAASYGATVKLIANANENVTVSKNPIVLDLNNFTLNGGTEAGKPALTINNKNVTVIDSSTVGNGTIMREDTNTTATPYYVIDIQGNKLLTFEKGIVTNNSGNSEGGGAALIHLGDDSESKRNAKPTLTIKGGTFKQENFTVIEIEYGTFYLKGGVVVSDHSYAVKNWHNANIQGGAVNGTVSSWAYSDGVAFSKLEISGGSVTGNVAAVNVGNAAGKQARVYITGGTVSGTLGTYTYDNALTPISDTAKATIEVTGGTFDKDPSAYVTESGAVTKNANGTFSVAKTCLAKIGDTEYYTMSEAFSAVQTGQTIVMQRDYTTNAVQNSGDKSFTINLNKHTWTYTGTDTDSAAFEINYSNQTLTVTNGKVVSNTMVGLIPSAMSGTITYNNSGLVFDGVEMTANGHSGIETNGDNTNDSITLKDSTLNVPNGYGIYFPSSGTLTIENSIINAKTMGVQVCAGSLEITGDKTAINVTGDSVDKTENDGAIEDGAAISVVDRTGYKGLATIKVENGTFTAKTDEALKAYKYENKTESKFDNTGDKLTVTGGAFSNDVKDYVAAGLTTAEITASGDTTYYVGKDNVEKAAAKAPSGSTVTVTQGDAALKNVPGGVTVKNTGEGKVTVNETKELEKDGSYKVPKPSSGGYYYYGPSISAVLNGPNKSATDYTSGDYGLIFRSTASYSSFTGVQVDGKTLAKGNYTAEANGSGTEVYLKASYLKTLAAGKHTVTILSTAGNVSMDFTIGGKTSSPTTFDAGVGVYAVTAVLSLTGMAWTAKKRQ